MKNILVFKKKSTKEQFFILKNIKVKSNKNESIINYCKEVLNKHNNIIKERKTNIRLWKFGDIDIDKSIVSELPNGYDSDGVCETIGTTHPYFSKLVFKSFDALILDYDVGLKKKDFMKATLNILGGLKISKLSYFIYDSFSSTKEKEKFKVVIPIKTLFAKTINYNKEFLANVFEINGFKPDSSCFNEYQWQNEPYRSIINDKSFECFSNITNYEFDLSCVLNNNNTFEESKSNTLDFIKDNGIVCKKFKDIFPKDMTDYTHFFENLDDSKNPLFDLTRGIDTDVRRTHNTNPLKKDIDANNAMYETIQNKINKLLIANKNNNLIKRFMLDNTSNKFECIQKYLGIVYKYNNKSIKEIRDKWLAKYGKEISSKWENKIVNCWVNK